MTTHTPSTAAAADIAAKLDRLESPVARRSVERLRAQYAQGVAVPSIEEIQEMLAKALGGRSIKELLDEARGHA